MPTTPHLEGRHKDGKAADASSEHDSDTAYGFDNNWGA